MRYNPRMPFLTPFDNDSRMRKFIAFDPILSDDDVAKCLDPLIPTEIDKSERACVFYFSEQDYTSEFRARLDARAREINVVVDAERKAESEARFKAYYESLNLDDTIEIPGKSDGRDIVFTCRPRKDGTLETVSTRYVD